MKSLLLIFCLLFSLSLSAQKKWSLQECVEYAIANNISIKQTEIQAKIADIDYKQTKLTTLPTANVSNNDGLRFGKSGNPSTGILENQNYLSVSLGFQSSIDIFNFFSKQNNIKAQEWAKLGASAQVDKLKNDIALTVTNAYLQVLLAKEQADIAEVQLKQSMTQLDIVRKQVNAGALPELNAIEIEAQLANDSANLVSARGNISDAKYALMGYMNLDVGLPFDVETPAIDLIPIEPIGELQPDRVYELALQNLPQQKINEFSILAAKSRAKAARGSMYPSISGYGALSTNYGYFRTPVYSQNFTGYAPSGFVVPNNTGGFIDVLRPLYTVGGKTGYVTSDPLGSQFSNNFGQQIGISINIPIFNAGQARSNYQRSLMAVRNAEYEAEQANANLKQDIYRAYNLAMIALEKFTSAQKAVEAAEKSYEFSTKRFNVGMLTTLEQITNQNNLFRAKLQQVLNRYDYVFKMKTLEFYKGQGLKL
ncbi:MAG: TolC family protein [Chitinophagaceae bacterium]|nr:TolC family protein [Chitinophagaceae bacterium]